jgi:hypothetical protein
MHLFCYNLHRLFNLILMSLLWAIYIFEVVKIQKKIFHFHNPFWHILEASNNLTFDHNAVPLFCRIGWKIQTTLWWRQHCYNYIYSIDQRGRETLGAVEKSFPNVSDMELIHCSLGDISVELLKWIGYNDEKPDGVSQFCFPLRPVLMLY